eukprot:TRINITY_DN2999_c0_g1_i1.p1 TRINITY_DN2999_c0_g1~~TRINITY_DN2999_c0_g1_i1.p1  ORF type:complete len:393 (+),score=89.75 TRINITY_DN2999_c0_g1_i1:434-1612(+)
MVYMIAFIPGCFIASWIVDRRSLRMGVCIGAILNALGGVLRVLPYPFLSYEGPNPGLHPYAFPAVMLGQTVAAIAQTFILSMPPKLAQNWFGERERVTATAIGALLNQLGVAVGFFIAPPLIRDDPNNIPLLLAVQAGMTIVSGIVVLIFFRSAPPTPPSTSASIARDEHSLLWVVGQVLRQGSFWVLLICFGVAVGSFYAQSTILDYVVSAKGYTDDDTSLFGVLIVMVGIGGALIAGVVADRTRWYKWLCFVALLGSTGCMAWFTLASVPDNRPTLAASCSMLGLFMTAILPVGMDLSVEITYPHPEAITASLLMMSAQIFGIIFVVAMTVMQGLGDHGITLASWFLTGCLGVVTVLILFFRPDYRRLAAEHATEAVAHASMPTKSEPHA